MPSPNELPPIDRVVGVDFSGARLAGRNTWLAEADVEGGGLGLRSLRRLEDHAGTAERDQALAWLARAIRASDRTLWAMDFPFCLPIELGLGPWRRQLKLLETWEGDARRFGHQCLTIARRDVGVNHVRRLCDVEAKTPFDCYHYRIIYQTFHGMRDVLAPLSADDGTATLPFDEPNAGTRRLVVEACPSSTLKRLGLPHHRYKQPGGKPVDEGRRAVRREIMRGIGGLIDVGRSPRRRLMADPGGDALDAVLAAAGGLDAVRRLGGGRGGSPRYRREGRIYG